MTVRFAFALSALTATPILAQATAPAAPAPASQLVRVAFETSAGRIVVDVDKGKAPITAGNFLRYVDSGRFNNESFYRAMPYTPGEGLIQGGIDVIRVGQGPSPMLYYAVHELDVDGGIQITGSHNPADYNGFKMLLPNRSVFGEEIKALGRRCAEGRWSDGGGTVTQVDIMDRYVERLVQDFSGKGFRIGWDAGNGAAGPAL